MHTIRIFFNRTHQGDQAWSLAYKTERGWEVHSASDVSVMVPSWSEKDLLSKLGAHYFWTTKGRINWVGTKAIITGDSHEKEHEEIVHEKTSQAA